MQSLVVAFFFCLRSTVFNLYLLQQDSPSDTLRVENGKAVYKIALAGQGVELLKISW